MAINLDWSHCGGSGWFPRIQHSQFNCSRYNPASSPLLAERLFLEGVAIVESLKPIESRYVYEPIGDSNTEASESAGTRRPIASERLTRLGGATARLRRQVESFRSELYRPFE